MSLSRSEQARLNGAKSRGPKTEAGKARSAMNATVHNLSGKGLVILDTEADEAFQALHQAFIDKFQPRDDIERDCLLQAAVARWRLRRVWKLETGIFNVRMLDQEERLKREWRTLSNEVRQTEAFIGRSDAINLLNRYERSVSREYERAVKAFEHARTQRQYAPEIENVQNEPEQDCEPRPLPAPRSESTTKKIQNEPEPPAPVAVIGDEQPAAGPRKCDIDDSPPLAGAA